MIMAESTSSQRAAADHGNNFDLVRLVAALQVVVVHFVSMIPGMRDDAWLRALSPMPGVPIFFFVSGYLITASWLRQPVLSTYVASRALRILPGLWLSCLFTLGMLAIFYTGPLVDNAGTALAWLLLQATILHVWNPDFLRGYGTGVANPSLWTIAVELCFYVALPLLVVLGQRLHRLGTVLAAAAAASFVVFYFVFRGVGDPMKASMVVKVMAASPVSFLTWLWMFVLGALAQLESARLIRLVAGRFLWFGGLALATGIASLHLDLKPILHLPGNEIGLLNAVTLGLASLSLAYSYPGLAQRWLRGQDLSYGMYVFHMPFANAFIASGLQGWPAAVAAAAGTLAAAAASWRFVESKALRLRGRLAARLSRRSLLLQKEWAVR